MQTVDRKLFRYVLLDLLNEKDYWIAGSPDKEKDILVIDIKNNKAAWIKDMPEEIKPDPREQKIKEVLALCEKERLEGGSDFKETTGVNAGPQVYKYLKYCGLPTGNPWCAAFVCWILGQCGIDNPKTADTWELEKWAINKKIYYTKDPQPGDVFLQLDSNGKPKHTGFVEKIDPLNTLYLLTVEGNTSDGIRHKNDKKVSECKYIRYI